MLVGAVLMMSSNGFAEVAVTPLGQKPIGSDVVVESAVREVKSIPEDTVNLVADTAMIVVDDVSAASRAVASVVHGSEREKAARKGELEVAEAWDVSGELQFRSYTVSDEIADLLETEAVDQNGTTMEVSGFFKGIKFGKGASAYYMPELKRLVVRQTMENILAIEYELADYQNVGRELLGHQVEIEVKFVEVSQTTLDELGFNWTFNDKNGSDLNLIDDVFLPKGSSLLSEGLRTASSVLGASEPGMLGVRKVSGSLSWDLVIKALEQANDTDVLSAPRIVTQDGQTATIEVGEERQVPKSLEVNQRNTSIYVQHSDWDLELMGVTLEVTPELRANDLIRLELNPKVVDLVGYDNYQVTPDNAEMTYFVYPTSADKYRPVPRLDGDLPYFRVREIQTTVTVTDGSTVGMGGLIYDKNETFKDKVPVLGSIPLLGRIFRSEGERSIKRNLMIFVTATQVDVNGRRVADLNLAN
jgi:general secretion pathway protein D